MSKTTPQMQVWAGDFGAAYTDRNLMSPEQSDRVFEAELGVTRTAINRQFLGDLPRDIRILEVGCNVGNQLALLGQLGFTSLWGLELQDEAAALARQRLPYANIVAGSALDLPFKDGYFDLVFTSRVLIHIAPPDLLEVLSEINRCTSRFVFGLEYFSEVDEEIVYRGQDQLLWKLDYPRRYLALFPGLDLVREVKYPCLGSDNVDVAYLLRKRGT